MNMMKNICMKTKFDSDDNLPSDRMIEIPIMAIVARAVFYENKIYCPQMLYRIDVF